MKIICEHCGSSINIDKDSKCPNCKAPYKNNKDYIKNYSDSNRMAKTIVIN